MARDDPGRNGPDVDLSVDWPTRGSVSDEAIIKYIDDYERLEAIDEYEEVMEHLEMYGW